MGIILIGSMNYSLSKRYKPVPTLMNAFNIGTTLITALPNVSRAAVITLAAIFGFTCGILLPVCFNRQPFCPFLMRTIAKQPLIQRHEHNKPYNHQHNYICPVKDYQHGKLKYHIPHKFSP